MSETDTIRKLWESLVDAKHYFKYGIVEQTKSKNSFSGEDALPIIIAYRNFEKARPYLSRELIEAVQSALDVAETGFNNLLDVFRSATSLPPGDPLQRIEHTRLAYETLNHTLREYQLRLTKIESLLSGAQLNKTTILFIAADPINESRLRLSEEFREIDEQLTLAKLRDRFNLELPQLSLRSRDIARVLLNSQPQIVHFSGHGTPSGALCFENEIGERHDVQPDALAALFEQFADQVNCVVLNACYSDFQAKAIAQHVNYVIGMNKAIGDKAAIAFALGLYQALGAGRTIEDAYKLGCVQIRLQGVPGHLKPVLVKKEQAESPHEAPKPKSAIECGQTPREVFVKLVFNKGGLVIKDEQELRASLVEALFAAENQLPVKFDVILEPLEVVERYIESIKSEEATPENRITRIKLQRQAKLLEKQHKVAILSLSLLTTLLRHYFLSADDLIESLHGLARMSLDFRCDNSVGSLALDIFRKNDPKLKTVIRIDETEQEEIRADSGSNNILAALHGCDLFDLPIKTRFRKAIPAIILIIAFDAIRTDKDVHELFDLSKVLDLYSWSAGIS